MASKAGDLDQMCGSEDDCRTEVYCRCSEGGADKTWSVPVSRG